MNRLKRHVLCIGLIITILVIIVMLFHDSVSITPYYDSDSNHHVTSNFNFKRQHPCKMSINFLPSKPATPTIKLGFHKQNKTDHDWNHKVSPEVLMKYPPLSAKHHDTADAIYLQPVHKLWTQVTKSIQAYRIAHFDNRTGAYGGPVIVTSILHDSRIEEKHPLYAKVIYSDGTEKCLNQGTYKRMRKPKSDELVRSYICYYKLPSSQIPYAVLLFTQKHCSNHSAAYLTVFEFIERPPPASEKYDFAVCLHQAIFNEADHEKVAAWIETNRALGAQHITLYYKEPHSEIVKTVQKYVNEGFVDAFDWPNNFTVEADNNFGQAILANECLYRYMNRTKYLALHDLDEHLVPHNASTWHSLMKNIDKEEYSTFKFCHAAFHLSHEPLSWPKGVVCRSLTKMPVVFERTKRTAQVNCKMTRWKAIIKPDATKRVGVHGAFSTYGHQELLVNPHAGLLHHYRANDYLLGEKSVCDLTMNKFVPQVMKGLMNKFCE